MIKKIVVLSLLLWIISGCGFEFKGRVGETQYKTYYFDKTCLEGVEYWVSGSSLAVVYSTSGKIKICETGK